MKSNHNEKKSAWMDSVCDVTVHIDRPLHLFFKKTQNIEAQRERDNPTYTSYLARIEQLEKDSLITERSCVCHPYYV